MHKALGRTPSPGQLADFAGISIIPGEETPVNRLSLDGVAGASYHECRFTATPVGRWSPPAARCLCLARTAVVLMAPEHAWGVLRSFSYAPRSFLRSQAPHETSERDRMENVWFIASAWMGLALLASLISIRLGISVALAEIFVGVLGGNFLGFHTTPWIDFLATFGSGLLTFLAGAEIDPESSKRHLTPSLLIGSVGFFFPFVGAAAFAYFVAGWDLRAAEIAGIALSTTSVAVVYAVMVETGLNDADLGKLILAACFVNDLGTVLALGVLFASFNVWMVVFVAVTAVILWHLPRVTRWVIVHWGSSSFWCCSSLAASRPWLRARLYCRPIWSGWSSPASLCATRCWYTGCAPSPSPCSHRFSLSRPAPWSHCRPWSAASR